MKLVASVLLLSVSAIAHAAPQPPITGTWLGTVTAHGRSIPAYLKVTGSPSNLKASLINGSSSTPATSAVFTNGHLLVTFNYFARTLDANLQDGALIGTFGGKRNGYFPITLHREKPAPAPKMNRPDLLGDWEIAVNSRNGEAAWQLRIAPSDAPDSTIRAVIQRIDGDTGALYGNWSGDSFLVSRATAAGFALYSITPQNDGTLLVDNLLDETRDPHVARRPADARKANLAPPTDTAQQTTMKDPNATFTFSFPDLSGKLVSSTDPQFDGKVVIVAIGGSWCPNCHDEAPFLVELYKKYHSSGLEIVNLNFEEEAQLANPTRLHAFVEHYGIPYTVLLAGNTDQLNEKITVANNLNCWPTSFFIGRDGKVKEIHAGYAGPGNPAANQALTHEVTDLVEHLLAEPAPIHNAMSQP
jgi:thiol-disulfide isomerase/thioredoxin